ncbi:MAG: hypothetical protein M0R32_11775 [Candidatus Cloacimonetes bacterium]|nr:hypothetical protein [Candidatus Cloacimonadota bacterium]
MSKFVWLVFYGMIHDGYECIGVFSSEEKANEHIAKQDLDEDPYDLMRIFAEKREIDVPLKPGPIGNV